MEVGKERVACREMSPERSAKAVSVKPTTRLMRPTFKKVQIVYYLSRNGQLEHPHYMEVTHLAHQHLRLKDVMDRLTVLRGKGMPSLYSWSCKRSYKNGYVWNDLGENDVIYPSEGAEYVLKGSELIEGCTEKLHQLGNNSQLNVGQDSNFQPKRKHLVSKQQIQPEEIINNCHYDHHHHHHHRHHGEEDGENEEEDEGEEEYEEKTSCTSRCSKGVSTDMAEEFKQTRGGRRNGGPSELFLGRGTNSFSPSPPSATSSTVSDKANKTDEAIQNNNSTSTRFADGDPVGVEPLLSRNSMLLSLIACGGSVSFRKNLPPTSPASAVVKQSPARKSGGDCRNLHRGVVCKEAVKKAAEEEDEMMIGCMSENPRFGNLQVEEKEYFSGSIVEAIAVERMEVEPRLKKSSSHNEERSTTAGLGDNGAEEEEVEKEKSLKGKCIPRKKSTSSKPSKK